MWGNSLSVYHYIKLLVNSSILILATSVLSFFFLFMCAMCYWPGAGLLVSLPFVSIARVGCGWTQSQMTEGWQIGQHLSEMANSLGKTVYLHWKCTTQHLDCGYMISPDVLPLCCRTVTPHPVLTHNHQYYVLIPANSYKFRVSHYNFDNYSYAMILKYCRFWWLTNGINK